MSQCYIHADLVKICQLLHIMQTKNCHADADADGGICTKNNMSPSPSVEGGGGMGGSFETTVNLI